MRGKPHELRPSGGPNRRFDHYKAEPERTVGLGEKHPAVVEGRTLFPGRLVKAMDSPRFLVSAENSPKIGGKITKGHWAGLPVYTLTLEERATCPRSCAAWRTCYGNAMHWPRRNDVADPDFIPLLAAETITLARQHPKGFVVRLHILGDFFSVAYVRAWARLLDMLPNLHVYGYTARRVDDTDPESVEIAKAIQELVEKDWKRFAGRTSHIAPGPDRTIIVDKPSTEPDVIMCPAQTGATVSCGTCALCWEPGARRKTIAFLLHGMKTTRKPRKPRLKVTRRSKSPSSSHQAGPMPGSDAWWAEREHREVHEAAP